VCNKVKQRSSEVVTVVQMLTYDNLQKHHVYGNFKALNNAVQIFALQPMGSRKQCYVIFSHLLVKVYPLWYRLSVMNASDYSESAIIKW
jgi:hypothetical protein